MCHHAQLEESYQLNLCFELLYWEATSAQVGANILRHILSTVPSLQAVLTHALVGRPPHTQVQGAPHFWFATQTVSGGEDSPSDG